MSSQGSANAHWPDRLLPHTGTGRVRERGLLGRGEKFCGDGEEAVPTRWCHRKGLPAMMLCPILLICVHTPQCCFCMEWGLCPTATALALHGPTARATSLL